MKKSVLNLNIGWTYLLLALVIFLSMFIETFYGVFLEPFIYGSTVNDWSKAQFITHWIITCISWCISMNFILRFAKRKLNFKLGSNNTTIEIWRWIVITLCIILSTTLSYINWNGFKVLIEFTNKGLLGFTFQYIYYFIESCMFTLIIIFGQLAFENLFKNTNIPYGGIICSITWGVSHFLTKGDFFTGIGAMFLGFIFGSSYLLLKRDTIKTIPILFLIFVL